MNLKYVLLINKIELFVSYVVLTHEVLSLEDAISFGIINFFIIETDLVRCVSRLQ